MYRQYTFMDLDYSKLFYSFWFNYSCYYFDLQVLFAAFSVNWLLNFMWNVRIQMLQIVMKDLPGLLNDGDIN